MKKLMIVLAAVAVAAVSQAASINWSIAQNQWVLNDGTKPTEGYAVYLINGATALSTIAGTIDATTGAFNDNQTWVFGSSVTSGSKGKVSLLTTTTDKLTRGSDYDFSVLIIDATASGGPKYMVSGVFSQTAYLTGEDEALGISFTSDHFGANALTYNATSAANGWAAVPEPTSGLLLLIGMAGLALKRKRV